ncbi:MAG: 30S ribosomal protein S10 [Mycoplasmataceae bacterium]|jgi:small subunit ribosomal protein S10|nr:30S ribosomal protein S10 [Mycoplasmataceae bacterium]
MTTNKINNEYRIKLTSYDIGLLENVVKQVVTVIKNVKLEFSGPVPLPTKKEVYTVLRDPFVHKVAMEQFERRLHNRLIIVKNSTQELLDELKKIIVPSTVEVKIK